MRARSCRPECERYAVAPSECQAFGGARLPVETQRCIAAASFGSLSLNWGRPSCIGPTVAGASAPFSPGIAASIRPRCSIRSPPVSPRISASSSACSRARQRSLTVLGAPDLIVLTLSEFAGQAYRINRAGNLPLMVDADHGYGNALNAKRTVEELETAGVARLRASRTPTCRRLTARPSRASPRSPKASAEMKAALVGRQDPALCIAGRTSAISISGPRRRHRPRQGLRGGGRRRAVLRRRQDAGRARCDLAPRPSCR